MSSLLAKDGRASFVAGDIKRGESISYELIVGRPTYGATSSGQVTAQRKGSLIEFNHSAGAATGNQPSQPLLAYQAEQGALPRDDIKPIFQRGGYLHPIRTPSGRIVTDDFPPNHIHHHGVWWAWTNTEFDGRKPDFWNMGDGKGRVEFVALEDSWNGSVQGGFRSRHRFLRARLKY